MTIEIRQWNKKLLILAALMTVGLFLRFYQLDFNSLWLDEAATYSLSVVPLGQIWTNMAGGEFNPPLFFVMEHAMLQWFGNSELTLRILPAIFGTLSIGAIYFVGKKFCDEMLGLVAAAAFTFSPFLIIYSQEARAYTLLLLLCCCIMYFFLQGLKTNQFTDWFCFAVMGIVAVWTHFYAVVFIIALTAYAFIILRKELHALVAGSLIWIIGCMPIFAALVSLIGMRTATAPTYGLQGGMVLVQTAIQFSGYSTVTTILFTILFALGITWAFFKAYENFLIIIWIGAITIAASVYLSLVIPMLPRYLIFLMIPFALGIGLAYKWFMSYFTTPSLDDRLIVVMYFIIFFGMMAAPFCMNYYSNYTKTDWRGIGAILPEMTRPGNVVIAVPNYAVLPLEYYYNATADQTALGSLTTAEGLEIARETISNRTFYIVTSDLAAADPSGRTLSWLMENSRIVATYNGVIIAVNDLDYHGIDFEQVKGALGYV